MATVYGRPKLLQADESAAAVMMGYFKDYQIRLSTLSRGKTDFGWT